MFAPGQTIGQIVLDCLQYAAEREGARLSMLAQDSPPLKRKETEKDLIEEITADIERHHMPPLFGVKYFEVDIGYWDSSFIKNHVYNQMSAAEKEEYKTVMKQSFALELLGACGFHCFKHDGKRKFLWGHLYAAKWAYRSASKKNIKFDDGQRKYNVLTDGNADKYGKVKMPLCVQKFVEHYCQTKQNHSSQFHLLSQTNSDDFKFFTAEELHTRMNNAQYFFPLSVINPRKLAAALKFDGSYAEFEYQLSKDLDITKVAKKHIETIYCKWFVEGFKSGMLKIGISEAYFPVT